MCQRDVILAAFQRGDRIKGSDSLRVYNIAEPSFKRIIHKLRREGVKIDSTNFKPLGGGHEYKEYYLAPSVSKLKMDTPEAATRRNWGMLEKICPDCRQSYYIADGKCNKCGRVRYGD